MNHVGTSSGSLSALVAQAADEFLDQLDRGEQPDLADFALRYPQIAGVLPQILPTLRILQNAKPGLGLAANELTRTGAIGDFRLIRELGRGGMGIVYEAEQVSLGRRVALKILPGHCGLDGKQLARFQIEAQVAAVLNHPHIVPIFAVGYDQGLHFHAMQLIDGCSLADLLRERAERLGTEAAFAPREAARMALQAALALEHAHSTGIVHRDIKPANLLLDHRDHLWVTDFGLAHLKGVSDLTNTGDMPGTLRYMSPEQADGKRGLDPRSDLYSLAATLYELLTAVPAFDNPDRQKLLRQISCDEPVSPRKRNPQIPRDLETIVQKAMAKEPDQRYSTAQKLADDLERFLADQPILARRPTFPEKASRWSRRHHRFMISVGSLLVVGAMVMAWGMAALWREQNRAHAALEKAQQARQREREALRFTFTASDQIAARALAMVAAPNAELGAGDREFCLHARDYYQQVSERYRDDPEMRRIAAAADHRIGFIRMILKNEDGEPDYRRSITLYEAALADTPADPELRVELASAYSDLALLFRRTQQQSKAVPCLLQVLTVLQNLVSDYPESRSYPLSLTIHQEQLMELFEAAGQVQKASEIRGQLRESYTRELARNPDDARSRNSLAWLLASRMDTSPSDASRAVELAGEAVKLAPEVGSFWNTLGVASYRAGQWNSAVSALWIDR